MCPNGFEQSPPPSRRASHYFSRRPWKPSCVPVFSDWDALEDGSSPFRVYCDASIDGFDAKLEQEQPDGSVRPTSYVSRATLDSERRWTPLEIRKQVALFGRSSASPRLLFGHEVSQLFWDHKALENIGKVGDHNARVQRWLENITALDYVLELYRNANVSGNDGLFSRLPQPATEHDRSDASRLTPVDNEAIYLVRACGVHPPFKPVAGIGFGGLMSQPDSAVLGGLPLAWDPLDLGSP